MVRSLGTVLALKSEDIVLAIFLRAIAKLKERVFMKTNKVHKRLTKIEAMISDLTKRYSKGAFHIRTALHNATAAVAHAKETVRSQLSSEKAKRSPVRRKKAAVKRAAVKTPTARTAKKSAPIKKAVKKAAASKTPATRVQAAAKPAAPVPIGK